MSTANGPDTCGKNPAMPSKIGDGPVSPARASCVENTALRAASASASAFQFDNCWTRVWFSARWLLIDRFTACTSCGAGMRISLPAASATAGRL